MKNFTIILSFLLCFLISFQGIQAQSQTDLEALKSYDKIETQNIAIVKKIYKELNSNRNVANLDELYSAEYKGYSPSSSNYPYSLKQSKNSYARAFEAFPDSKYVVKNMFADGDYVIVNYVFTGTHERDYWQVEANGYHVESGAITIYRLKNGKIAETWSEFNSLDFKDQMKNEIPNGWWKIGDSRESYSVGIDKENYYEGIRSTFIVSIEENIDGFSGLLQSIDAKPFIGKKIKFTGFAKSENIEGWAGFWLRIDGESKVEGERPEMLGFDNMEDRPIKGTTEWAKYEIIMDVPDNSTELFYGTVLSGKGKLWFDNISFEEITDDESYPVKYITEGPINTSFEE